MFQRDLFFPELKKKIIEQCIASTFFQALRGIFFFLEKHKMTIAKKLSEWRNDEMVYYWACGGGKRTQGNGSG